MPGLGPILIMLPVGGCSKFVVPRPALRHIPCSFSVTVSPSAPESTSSLPKPGGLLRLEAAGRLGPDLGFWIDRLGAPGPYDLQVILHLECSKIRMETMTST